MPTTDAFTVGNLGRALTDANAATGLVDNSGAQVVIDFVTKAILDGRGYQVRAGTITAPVTGDVLITDTAAEMCTDAAAGQTIMPISLNFDIEALNGGTLPQVAAKSVATVSSSGTAFVALPLLAGGAAASTTSRVQAAGAVTVTAELATTTLQHFLHTNDSVDDVIAHNFFPIPRLDGAWCFYVQVGGVTAGPTYFANYNFLEFPTANLGG